jgi:hypothetical protein
MKKIVLAGAISVVTIAAMLVPSISAGAVENLDSGANAHNTYFGRSIHAGSTKGGGPLIDKGGKVLPNSTTYAIFWGPSADFPSDIGYVKSFLQALNGSTYLKVADQYMRGTTASTTYKTFFNDSTSQPPKTSPSLSVLASEVTKILAANSATVDPNAIYMIYTSNYGAKTYCAYHDQVTVNGVKTQVAYIPNTAGVQGCDPGNLNSSTLSEGTRSIAESTAHEFMEAITDAKPGTAWSDQSGYEIGDKCEALSNEVAKALPDNDVSTGYFWQLQSEWSNSLGSCPVTY